MVISNAREDEKGGPSFHFCQWYSQQLKQHTKYTLQRTQQLTLYLLPNTSAFGRLRADSTFS
jgi:hypothetical protein